MSRLIRFALLALAAPAVGSCISAPAGWQLVQSELPGALLSVWGSSSRDVYFAGSDARDGSGPMFVHYDGNRWRRIGTGVASGDLWWVSGFERTVYVVGSNGLALRFDRASLTASRMTTPDDQSTLFGVWGASDAELWAVGTRIDTAGNVSPVLWRFADNAWSDQSAALPTNAAGLRLYKIWGTASDAIWAVGEQGLLLQYDGRTWSSVPSNTTARLLTVNGNAHLACAVGGRGTAVVLENTGAGWQDVSPDSAPSANGVYVYNDDDAVAVGITGAVMHRHRGAWSVDTASVPTDLDLHSVWVDPDGGTWTVGGQITTAPFGRGLVAHEGGSVVTGALEP